MEENLDGIDDHEAIKDAIRQQYWQDLEEYQDEFPFCRFGLTVSPVEGENVFYDHIEDN